MTTFIRLMRKAERFIIELNHFRATRLDAFVLVHAPAIRPLFFVDWERSNFLRHSFPLYGFGGTPSQVLDFYVYKGIQIETYLGVFRLDLC
jgi:hypothetical protein